MQCGLIDHRSMSCAISQRISTPVSDLALETAFFAHLIGTSSPAPASNTMEQHLASPCRHQINQLLHPITMQEFFLGRGGQASGVETMLGKNFDFQIELPLVPVGGLTDQRISSGGRSLDLNFFTKAAVFFVLLSVATFFLEWLRSRCRDISKGSYHIDFYNSS